MLTFAYGSNMDWNQMRERCPSSRFVGIAVLRDHKLAFTRKSLKRGCGVADLIAEGGAQEHVFSSAVFGANPPRCARVWNEEVMDFAERFLKSPPTHWQTGPLPALPSEESPLDQVPSALQGLVAQAADLVPLLQDEQAFGEQPSEDELIVHFVVPFLRALGWPPERIAVQWRRIDVAVFRALPRTPENCHLVIEAKRLGAGVEGALDQAKGYVGALGLSRDVIVTDGIRYRMYAGDRDFAPVAYANLARLKRPAADLFARMQRP
jgi:hypothetical protein